MAARRISIAQGLMYTIPDPVPAHLKLHVCDVPNFVYPMSGPSSLEAVLSLSLSTFDSGNAYLTPHVRAVPDFAPDHLTNISSLPVRFQ